MNDKERLFIEKVTVNRIAEAIAEWSNWGSVTTTHNHFTRDQAYSHTVRVYRTDFPIKPEVIKIAIRRTKEEENFKSSVSWKMNPGGFRVLILFTGDFPVVVWERMMEEVLGEIAEARAIQRWADLAAFE